MLTSLRSSGNIVINGNTLVVGPDLLGRQTVLSTKSTRCFVPPSGPNTGPGSCPTLPCTVHDHRLEDKGNFRNPARCPSTQRFDDTLRTAGPFTLLFPTMLLSLPDLAVIFIGLPFVLGLNDILPLPCRGWRGLARRPRTAALPPSTAMTSICRLVSSTSSSTVQHASGGPRLLPTTVLSTKSTRCSFRLPTQHRPVPAPHPTLFSRR
jgi:hypothetical protein